MFRCWLIDVGSWLMRRNRQRQVLVVFTLVVSILVLNSSSLFLNYLDPNCATFNFNASSPTTIISSWKQFQTSCKPSYIVIDPIDGLGNRILSIASAIAYGIVTHRGVRVHWGPDYPAGAYPARLSELFDDRAGGLGSWEISFWGKVLSSPNLVWHTWRNKFREVRGGDWPSLYFDESMACERQDSLLRLGHAEWVRTGQYFLPALEANAAHKWIRFDDRGRGFLFHAFWTLMRPAKDILDAADEFRKKAPGKDKAVWIGVHARRLEEFWIPTEWYAAAAQEAAASLVSGSAASQAPRDIIYFLASDNVTFYSDFAARVQHASDRILYYSDAPTTRTSAAAVKRAMTELVLLGTSDVVVGTEHSTFSMVASSISGTNPFVVYRDKETYGYKKLITSEPCFMTSGIDTSCGVSVPLRRGELVC